MDDANLKRIIDRKNERLEEDALRNASDIIDEIGREQAKVRTSNERIAKLRTELRELEVTSVDASEILGGE